MSIAIEIVGYLLFAVAIICFGLIIKSNTKENIKGWIKCQMITYGLFLLAFLLAFIMVNNEFLYNIITSEVSINKTIIIAFCIFCGLAIVTLFLSIINIKKQLNNRCYNGINTPTVQSKLMELAINYSIITLIGVFISKNLPT